MSVISIDIYNVSRFHRWVKLNATIQKSVEVDVRNGPPDFDKKNVYIQR